MATDPTTAPKVTLAIPQAEYDGLVANHVRLQTITGPCAKCNGARKVTWISRAAATFGQPGEGACRRCNGKGFLTVADNDRNTAYEAFVSDRIARDRERIARDEATVAELAASQPELPMEAAAAS